MFFFNFQNVRGVQTSDHRVPNGAPGTNQTFLAKFVSASSTEQLLDILLSFLTHRKLETMLVSSHTDPQRAGGGATGSPLGATADAN